MGLIWQVFQELLLWWLVAKQLALAFMLSVQILASPGLRVFARQIWIDLLPVGADCVPLKGVLVILRIVIIMFGTQISIDADVFILITYIPSLELFPYILRRSFNVHHFIKVILMSV